MVPISFAYLARFTKGLRCDFKLTWHEQICKLCKVGMIWGDHQSPHRSPLRCSPLCKVAPMLANQIYGDQGGQGCLGCQLVKANEWSILMSCDLSTKKPTTCYLAKFFTTVNAEIQATAFICASMVFQFEIKWALTGVKLMQVLAIGWKNPPESAFVTQHFRALQTWWKCLLLISKQKCQ